MSSDSQDRRQYTHYVPTQVSNRHLVEQLKLWGWVHKKNKGDTIVMHNPLLEGNTDVTVMKPDGPSKGNSTFMIQRVYQVVTGGSAEAFWALKYVVAPAERELVIEAIETPEVDEANEAVEVTQDDPPAPIELEVKRMERGLSARVLTFMECGPHLSYTIGQIAKAFNVSRVQAGNALNHLHSRGHVERIMKGTFRLAPKLAAQETVHHAHTGPVEVQLGTSYTPKPNTVARAMQPESEPEPDQESIQDMIDLTDEYLDELLELILPDDYRFKPKHLNAMAAWKRATAELLTLLQS